MSEAKSLVSKLAEVMAEIGHVPKRGKNEFHGYKYVMEADLCDAVREKLASRNVMMIPSVLSATREKVTLTNKRGETADSLISDVMVEYALYDGDSNEKITFRMPGCGSDTGDKGVYKALTGSDKYALMKAFLIPTGDDPEADAETDARAEGFRQAPKAEREALAQKKISNLKEAGFSEKHDALKAESKVVKPVPPLKEGEQVISGVVVSVSANMPKKDGDGEYIKVEVGPYKFNVFDTEAFSLIRGMKGKAVNCIVKKKGQYLNFVAMELAPIQIKDEPEDPFALTEPPLEVTDEDVPF